MSQEQANSASSRPSLEALILDAILESAAAGILSITSKGIIRTVNAAACKMFGYRAEELLGQNVSILTQAKTARTMTPTWSDT